MSHAPPNSTISRTSAGADEIKPKFNNLCKNVFSKTYKKSAVKFSNLTEQEVFLCSSRWVIDDWLISSLWELSSQRGVEYLSKWRFKGRNSTDKDGFKLQNLDIGLLPTNFLDLDIFEILFVLYLIQKYIKLCFER